MNTDKYLIMFVHPRLRDIQIVDGRDLSAYRLLQSAGYVLSDDPEEVIDEYWRNALKVPPEGTE
jgi:hypothetical protein